MHGIVQLSNQSVAEVLGEGNELKAKTIEPQDRFSFTLQADRNNGQVTSYGQAELRGPSRHLLG